MPITRVPIAALVLVHLVTAPPSSPAAARPLRLSSPSGDVTLTFEIKANPQPYLPGDRAYYCIACKGVPILLDSPLGLDLLGAEALDRDFEVAGTKRRSEDSSWENPLGTRRVVMLASTPGRLIENNDLLLNLNPPSAMADISWIKPGKASWDWWSGSNATGVDFASGMNTATMKRYVDFAAAHGLEYMCIDAGWSPPSAAGYQDDVLKHTAEVNVPGIIAYARGKGVRVIL